MNITFKDADRWLTDNVIVLTHMAINAKDDIHVAHESRDMRPLTCSIDTKVINI